MLLTVQSEAKTHSLAGFCRLLDIMYFLKTSKTGKVLNIYNSTNQQISQIQNTLDPHIY